MCYTRCDRVIATTSNEPIAIAEPRARATNSFKSYLTGDWLRCNGRLLLAHRTRLLCRCMRCYQSLATKWATTQTSVIARVPAAMKPSKIAVAMIVNPSCLRIFLLLCVCVYVSIMQQLDVAVNLHF